MNAPTLLIGLGGTGCKIIERVSKMVTGEQRNNIAFAVFDTDINDLRGIQERNPFIKTIQTSTKQTVGEYLNKDTHARDTWFPVNAILNGKTLTEGAGQVRSISRLALETVIRAGKMEPLHEAIQSLYKVEEDKADQALRVVIVSSLAGGTGSGLILPVALYTRNYLQTHFRQSANITRGFFILPEVFYEVITGQTERNNLKANAYATLRELDAFLMKGDATLHERYANSVRMQFPRAASNGYEEYDVRPYDFCFLFDAQNAEGGKLNSFDQYLDHAANCIYAQSIGPMNKRSNSSEDNTIRKLAKERGRNRYAGAGASMLVYPFEDIRTLIALKWTKQCVSKQWMVFDDLYKELCKENDYLSSPAESPAGTAAGTGSIGSTHAAGVVAPADHIKTCGREWTESLSKENKAAIYSYTGTAYSNINARLRGLGKSFDPGNQECAIRIHQALSGASIPADCTVYRGVSSKALGMLRMLPDNMLVGKTFTDHGFMSTSLERNSAFGGDMLLEVDVPKGAHGAYVGDISNGWYRTRRSDPG